MRSPIRTPLPAPVVLFFCVSSAVFLGAAAQTSGRGPGRSAAGPTASSGRSGAAAEKDPNTWPTPADMESRRKEAEARRLFQSDAPFPFTLAADFKAITRDRNPESTRTFPAVITYTDEKGGAVSKALQLRNRGHARRQVAVCDFPPLRLEFGDDKVAHTMFEGHKGLKLGTHCRDVGEFEQYVLREYLAYRILNLITPQSFRVRLAKATYVDAVTKKPIVTRYGMFIEDDDDVARRLKGRVIDTPNMMYRHFNADNATWFALFEYMIGNTDVSIVTQHNVRTIETPTAGRYIVPYDFDYSGLVNTSYAIPNKQLGLPSVRDRLYRGPCRQPEELEPFFTRLRALQPQIMALYDTLPDLTDAYRRNAKNYLLDFYKTINQPSLVKRDFVSGCVKSGI